MSSVPSLTRAAYHEAGHAVVRHSYGCTIRRVSVIARESSLGRCEASPPPALPTWSARRAARARIVCLFAGMAAEARLVGQLDLAAIDHAGNDLREAAELVRWLGVRGSLVERMRAAGDVGRRARRLLAGARWRAVERIARALIEAGEIDQPAVGALLLTPHTIGRKS